MSEQDWPEQDPPQTDQEDIAFLRGTPIPDRGGYSFGEEVVRNGDVFDIEVVRDTDSASVGTARGTTAADMIREAQSVAADADDDA